MFRNNKTIGLVLITFLLIAGIFAQTTFLAPTISISNSSSTPSEEDALKTPKASDVSGHYDYGDGTTMDIDAVDNTTTTTLTNTTSGESFTIESKKNDTSTSTLLNNSYMDAGLILTSDVENKFQLETFNNTNPLHKLDLIIPNKNQMALNISDISGNSVKFFSNATLDDENDSLDSFYTHARYSSGFLNVTYRKNDPDGYDLNIVPGGQNTSVNYDIVGNEYKWIDHSHRSLPFGVGNQFTSEYTINNSGVWRGTSQVIDWTTPDLQTFSYKDVAMPIGDIYQIHITKFYDTRVIHYSTFVAQGFIGQEYYMYQLVFTNTTLGTIMMDYELSGSPMRVHWRDKLITIYLPVGGRPEYAVFTYQLRDISDLVYNVVIEIANSRIMFLKKWNELIVGGVRFSVLYIESYIYISMETALSPMGSYWGSQFWGLDISYRFDTLLNLFLVYKIEIGYKTRLYIYLVPTLILPNFLTITIIESVYTNSWFYITIRIADFIGYSRSGAAITGTWDGADIGTVDDNGDGTYNFTLQAKFILPGEDPLWLNLTASSDGYANGTLNTGIAIEPLYPDPPQQLIITIINSIYTTDWFNLTVEITNCSGDLETVDSFSGFWNGTAIPIADIADNFDGTFNITLEAIIVSPGDPGILLSLTATKSGYFPGELNTEIAVDPDAVDKAPGDGVPPDGDGGGDRDLWEEEVILGYNLFILIGVVSILSIILVKKHKKIKI